MTDDGSRMTNDDEKGRRQPAFFIYFGLLVSVGNFAATQLFQPPRSAAVFLIP
jgi:hypothetical protein